MAKNLWLSLSQKEISRGSYFNRTPDPTSLWGLRVKGDGGLNSSIQKKRGEQRT